MGMHRWIRKFLGRPIECHTHFGTFRGVLVHFNKTHIILAVAHYPVVPPMPGIAPHPQPAATPSFPHGFRWGPGPIGPGPLGPGPGFGSGWQVAIPLAAIIGITALGMHWW